MKAVDLNSDMGESYSIYRIGDDASLIKYITSANLACGFHGGDPSVTSEAIRLCRENGLAMGAHPSFPDLQGFGRREMELPARDLLNLLLYQVGALEGLASAQGGDVFHLKAHGALYNMACKRDDYARAIAECALEMKKVLIAPGSSAMQKAADSVGVRFAAEGFADRRYQSDGTLTSRGKPGALLTNPQEAAEQALRIVDGSPIKTVDGGTVRVRGITLCVHSDTPGAAEIARAVRRALESGGVQVKTLREIL